jgi:peptidoglycan/LPS O-acetylase OafA/YrhL
LIFGLSATTGILEKMLTARWLLFLGGISYSTYMIHYLLKHWVKFLLVKTDGPQGTATLVYLSAVLLGSVLLHRFVELPGRKLISSRYRTKAIAVASTQPSS